MDRRRLLLVALAFACVLLAASVVALGPRFFSYGEDGPISNPTDFRAFYCGGAVVAMGADPYRVQPLMGCEARALAAFGLQMIPNFVLPAPLPPYALAGFSLLARLPFPIASVLWCVLSLGFVCATIVFSTKLARLPLGVVAGALVASEGFASLVIGQIVPLVVACLVLAALALRRERYVLAALALGVAMIEPHLGLPAALAAFAFVPRARLPLAVVGGFLAVVSLASVGIGTNVEYFARVLPAHARSEVAGFDAQYSLTSLAFALGATEHAAVVLGECSYVASVAAGLAVAAKLRARWNDASVFAVVPPAFAAFGGVFIHIHQMAAVVPFALLFLAKEPKLRVASIAIVAALAIPWESIAETPTIMHAYARGHVARARVMDVPRSDALAEDPEVAYIRSGGSYYDGRTFADLIAWKLPTWLALATLVALGSTVAFRPRGSALATADLSRAG